MVRASSRLSLIKARHRRILRSQGAPCGLSQDEKRQLRRELGRGVPVPEVAEHFGVTPRKVRISARASPMGLNLIDMRLDSIERRSIVRRKPSYTPRKS
jgi:hypothetical protein